MKVRDIIILFFVICSIGCVNSSIMGSLYKPDVSFAKSMKIAVVKFKTTAQSALGQEAADLMEMAFFKKGFDVIDMNQILSTSEQNQVYDTGLTAEVKTKLQNYGVTAVITGTISEYKCSTTSSYLYSDFFQTCHVSFSATMIDIISGEILWGLSSSDTKTGDDLQADSVLRIMIRSLDKEIPVDLNKKVTNK